MTSKAVDADPKDSAGRVPAAEDVIACNTGVGAKEDVASTSQDVLVDLGEFDLKAIAEKPYADVTPEEKAAWNAEQAKKQAQWEDEWERFEEGAAAAEEAVFAQAPAARMAKAKMEQRQKNIAEAQAKQQEKLQEQAEREYVLKTPEDELSEGDRIRKAAARAARNAVQVRRNRNMAVGFCFLALAYGVYGVSSAQVLAMAAGFVCLVACIAFSCILSGRYKKAKVEFDVKNAKLDEYENAHPEYVRERKARAAAKAAESFGLDGAEPPQGSAGDKDGSASGKTGE